MLIKVHRYMREHSESEFYNPEDVIAAAKVLLWQRQRSSVSKIKQLLRASMMQHGENDRITVFALCFVSVLRPMFSRVILIGCLQVYCIEEDMQRVAGKAAAASQRVSSMFYTLCGLRSTLTCAHRDTVACLVTLTSVTRWVIHSHLLHVWLHSHLSHARLHSHAPRSHRKW